MRLSLMMAAMGNAWRVVAAPDAAFAWLPFAIQQRGRTFRPSPAWSIDLNRPTGKTYYVSTTGNDANDGLSAAAPLRKIAAAIAKADVDVIYVAAGAYGWTNGWTNAAVARSISVIATGGRVTVGTFAEGLTWTADGTAYKATRSHVLKVADTTVLDAHGDYTFLTLVADVATCQATPGSWYTDATTTWVHTTDSRSPGTTVRCYFDNTSNAGVHNAAGNTTLYCEGLDFEGGTGSCFGVGVAGSTKTAYFNNCTFKYSSANGLAIASGPCVSYCKSCTAAANVDYDGFSYHKGAAGAAPLAVEIDCIGRDNGAAGDIDNGSTIHDGGTMIRINGEYMRCVGPVIHDITSGTKSWNLGTYAHDSTSAINDINFAVGTGGTDTAEMWLDYCKSAGSAVDIAVDTQATCHVRALDGEGNYTGDPVDYDGNPLEGGESLAGQAMGVLGLTYAG